MTIFLALTPHSVCNGAVKTKPLKQLEIELLNAVNDSGYLSYGSASKIGHRPRLVSVQQLQPRSHLGPAQRENLKTEPLYHLNVIKFGHWQRVRSRMFEQESKKCHITSARWTLCFHCWYQPAVTHHRSTLCLSQRFNCPFSGVGKKVNIPYYLGYY